MNKKECCGTCKWCQIETVDDGMVCVNDSSDYCTDWVEPGFCCDEWESND